MTDKAKLNLPNINNMIEMFQHVAEPKIFWWSITIPEDITASGGIDVSMYRWGELLQTGYGSELCNIGGIGNKDRSQWILYAVTGEGMTLENYRKIADVCSSVVKALEIPRIPKFKPTVIEKLDIVGDYKCFKSATPARHKKFVDWRESTYRSLWITEKPTPRLSVSEYLDALVEAGDKLLPASGGSTVESFWILSWFEFIFGTAPEPGCLIRTHSGSQWSTGWEMAEIPFRRIDNDICEASILALKFLENEVKARIGVVPRSQGQTTTVETPKDARQVATEIPDYIALDLAKRTLTIGTTTQTITSEKVWDFLKDLCSALRDDRLVSRYDGATNNKNNIDQLRRKIGKDALHKLIISVDGCYKLNPEVKIIDGGQIGIRKTHLSHRRK